MTVRDPRIGKHKFEIHFSRKDDQTQFEALKGDAEIVERCNLQQKIARLKVESEPISQPRTPENTTPTSFRQWSEEVLKPALLN